MKMEAKKREKAKIYCTVIDIDSNYDCTLVAVDKKNLQRQLDQLNKDGKLYSIAHIVKGHHISFVEKSVIDFV